MCIVALEELEEKNHQIANELRFLNNEINGTDDMSKHQMFIARLDKLISQYGAEVDRNCAVEKISLDEIIRNIVVFDELIESIKIFKNRVLYISNEEFDLVHE